MSDAADDFLRMSERVRVLPIIHGSGDFAIRVREEMLARTPDCLAVPLPASFQDEVERACLKLPVVSAVVQRDADAPAGAEEGYSYVPIDPCQGVIAAVRLAQGERIARAFIDLETPWYEPVEGVFPDAYALKKVTPAEFAAAVLPTLVRPEGEQHRARIAWMAKRLLELEKKHRDVLLVCSLLDWPWIREAYQQGQAVEQPEEFYAPLETFEVSRRTLAFFLGELPFLTALYERGRSELTADDNLSVDGIKELLLEARDRFRMQDARAATRITPHLLSVYLRYVRNLCLMNRRLTPDLYTLVMAAKQTAGDGFALALAETSRDYPFQSEDDTLRLRMGIGLADVPGWGRGTMTSRLPGQVREWNSIELRPGPSRQDRERWSEAFTWNPHCMCTWPAEDDWRDAFNQHIRDQARAVLGADLARSEKFTTSVMDGLDIRETLRHWHTGELFVKVIPPQRGSIDVVVFLFDVPADPRKYTHRATWGAEHRKQSWLTFFASDHRENVIGPGIALGEYGGMLLLFPPRPYPDIWTDPRLDLADTLEERLIAGGLLHSQEKHLVVVCHGGLHASWQRLARRYRKKLIHLPMGRFSVATMERLRHFHVLNGFHIRSYAADFIRDFT